MVQQITNGIKISAETRYNGTIKRNGVAYHTFSYYIHIDNESKDTVQLLERLWEISDALNHKEIVEGEGVVGQKPIIEPKGVYNYKSNCFLHGSSGSMKGSFKMINTKTNTVFRVTIPTFQLTSSPLLN